MRTLLLLRGSPGCGKSTWIEQNGLKPYTLSADDIRLLCQSPVLSVDGTECISQSNDSVVWKTLFTLLETRMQKGEFTVIDATNSKTSEMNRYKQMSDTYRYRIFCVDFTDIPIEEVKRRNANRESMKKVPEEVIENMFARFKTQKIPSGIKVIKPNELDTIWTKLYDFSDYKRIHHIGDIHGCNTALQKYLSDNGGIKDDEMYIFTGDYIDRGVENAEVVEFLASIADRKNVLMLEGNHERWLWLYANDCVGHSKEFELVTKPELDRAGVDKKSIRNLYRRLGQCAYYKYDDKVFLVTHGGLSSIPGNLTFVATSQMIGGVGNYNESEAADDSFIRTTPQNVFQIHGHRNTKDLPIKSNDRVYNLEGKVEFGGYLRCVQVDKQGIHTVEIKNDTYKSIEVRQETESKVNNSISDVILSLRSNNYVEEKRFGNISSFNFTRQAFYDKAWDEQTTKARGLYIDTEKCKVVARAYNKFFNINERPETKFDMLRNKLRFPITAYVKENGFLGIVSYDEYKDDLLVATKSTIDSQFTEWFKNMLTSKISSDNLLKLKEFVKENNVSMVFECVDMENDPHIIEYPESELYLLDIIKNDLELNKYEYESLVEVASKFDIVPKERAYEIATWQEFFDWYYDILTEDYEYHGRKIEGFVIEDANGFMTKLKLTYYNFWKFMRNVAFETMRFGYIRKTSALTTPLANEFYGFMKKLCQETDNESLPRNICALRNMYYKRIVS